MKPARRRPHSGKAQIKNNIKDIISAMPSVRPSSDYVAFQNILRMVPLRVLRIPIALIYTYRSVACVELKPTYPYRGNFIMNFH